MADMFRQDFNTTGPSVEFLGEIHTPHDLLEKMPGAYDVEFSEWKAEHFDELYTPIDVKWVDDPSTLFFSANERHYGGHYE